MVDAQTYEAVASCADSRKRRFERPARTLHQAQQTRTIGMYQQHSTGIINHTCRAFAADHNQESGGRMVNSLWQKSGLAVISHTRAPPYVTVNVVRYKTYAGIAHPDNK